MSTEQKDLEKLLALKKKQEEQQVLNQLDMLEKMKLERRYMAYVEMNSQQMAEDIQKKGEVQQVVVQSTESDPIVEDYKKAYANESWYKEPEISGNRTTLCFPSQETMADFFSGQAHQQRPFMVVDKASNKVLAYSNGDGVLYNGNGSVYTSGAFEPSEQVADDFHPPEPKPRPGMTS